MRKYTSPAEKIEKYSIKYNLGKEEVTRIIKSDDCLLSIDELKIKYDNENLGLLPEWLTEDDLINLINKVININYNSIYKSWISREDLFSELYLQAKLKVKEYQDKNLKYLSTCIKNWMVNLGIVHNRRSKHFYRESLDKDLNTDSNEDDSVFSYGDYVSFLKSYVSLDEFENEELKVKLSNIDDSLIYDVIVTIAYLVCGIDSFKEDYELIKVRQKDTIKHNLVVLESKIYDNDIIYQTKYDEDPNKLRTIPITIKDVLATYYYDNAFNEDRKINKNLFTKNNNSNIRLSNVLDNFKNYMKREFVV